MSNVLLKFEREDREGYVAVGTYLIDAAKRFGIDLTDAGEPEEMPNPNSVLIVEGSQLLSPLTLTETEHFSAHGRKDNERLASQARIESAGEIVIMTNEKKTAEETVAGDQDEKYKKDFTEMPLEKKIAALVQLEVITLGETFSFIYNSPSLIFSKVMDVMAEFGLKKESDAKDAARPEEHKTTEPKTKTKTPRTNASAAGESIG